MEWLLPCSDRRKGWRKAINDERAAGETGHPRGYRTFAARRDRSGRLGGLLLVRHGEEGGELVILLDLHRDAEGGFAGLLDRGAVRLELAAGGAALLDPGVPLVAR